MPLHSLWPYQIALYTPLSICGMCQALCGIVPLLIEQRGDWLKIFSLLGGTEVTTYLKLSWESPLMCLALLNMLT